MTTGRNKQKIYRIGAFTFHSGTGELARGGARVGLRPQAAAVLSMLVERAGELVTREELRDELWQDGRVVSFDMAISTVIRQLRRELEDDPKRPRYIETIPKRGYRFRAPVERVAERTSAGPLRKADRTGPTAMGRAAGLLFLTIATLFLGGTGSPPVTRSSNVGDTMLVAVLPFANLTDRAGYDVLAHALSDNLVGYLSRVAPSRLKVAGRTSVLSLAGSGVDAAQTAAALDADYLVEGSVTREGAGIVIRARLVSGTDGSVAWSRDYQSSEDRPEMTARAIAARTVEGLVGTGLVGERSGIAPADHRPSAVAAYREGRLIRDYRGPERVTEALERFRAAVEIDPDFAPAHAALAEILVSWRGPEKTPERMAEARLAAKRALDLDPDLAEAHRALGEIHLFYDGDWDGAERRLTRAVELAPGSAEAHHSLALWLSARGRHGRALDEIDLARELDPRSLAVSLDVMFIHFYARDFGGTVEAAKRLRRHWPENPGAARFIVMSEAARGNLAAAGAEARRALETRLAHSNLPGPEDLEDDAKAVKVFFEATADRLERFLDRHRSDPIAVAMYQVCAGRWDRATDLVNEALEEGSFSYFVPYLGVSPALDPLRGRPEFERALRRVGQAGLSGTAEGSGLRLASQH